MIEAIGALTLYDLTLYGLTTAMLEIKDWLGRKYNNNPPYIIRIMHIIGAIGLIYLITRGMG